MFFKKDEWSIVGRFYLAYLLLGVSFMIFPYMVIYFINLGFSMFQVAVLMGGMSLAIFLSEIPTGAFADAYSRKYSVIIGYVIRGISAVLFFYFTNFWILFFLIILSGVGAAFTSGADIAWAIALLNKHKRKDLHHEYFIKVQVLVCLGIVVGPLFGVLIVKSFGIPILWVILGCGMFGAALILASIPEDRVLQKHSFMKSLRIVWNNTRKATSFLYTHSSLLLLTFALICVIAMGAGDLTFQPFLTYLSLPVEYLGIVFAIMGAFLTVFSFLSRYLIKYSLKRTAILFISLRSVLLLGALFVYPPFFIVGAGILVLDASLYNLTGPLFQTYFNKKIPEKIRATTLSTISMLHTGILGLLMLLFGYLIDVTSVAIVIASGAIFGAIAIFLISRIKDTNF